MLTGSLLLGRFATALLGIFVTTLFGFYNTIVLVRLAMTPLRFHKYFFIGLVMAVSVTTSGWGT